ncbi:MAG: phosphate ABC transporter substrate-binding protein [Pseudomonadales bacterium]|nr:phosphate ABC transporter substrate-binding protein [Pseudomonadales bacterium]
MKRYNPLVFKKISHVILPALFAIFLFPSFSVQAGVVVVVSNQNATAELDEKQVYNIFMGKAKSFPDGEKALPVDQKKGTENRDAFRETILQKSSSQLNTYWSRLIFTGKGTPPQESGDSADVKSLISDNPNLIGYIDSADVDASVKVLLEL